MKLFLHLFETTVLVHQCVRVCVQLNRLSFNLVMLFNVTYYVKLQCIFASSYFDRLLEKY